MSELRPTPADVAEAERLLNACINERGEPKPGALGTLVASLLASRREAVDYVRSIEANAAGCIRSASRMENRREADHYRTFFLQPAQKALSHLGVPQEGRGE